MTAKEIKTKLHRLSHHQGSILGEDDMFNAAVLIPFFETEGEIHILFQKRTQDIRQGGEISFPGGAYDAHENDAAVVATRECKEELGISEEKIHILGRMGSIVSPKKIIIDACIGWLDINSLEELVPNRDEVETVFSIPLEYFLNTPPETYHVRFQIFSYQEDEQGKKEVIFPAEALGIPSMYHDSWGETLHPIYHYKTDYGPLWGFTAEYIVALIKELSYKKPTD